jgi:hypothetical protein
VFFDMVAVSVVESLVRVHRSTQRMTSTDTDIRDYVHDRGRNHQLPRQLGLDAEAVGGTSTREPNSGARKKRPTFRSSSTRIAMHAAG